MDFSNYTLEQIDALDRNFIKTLSWGDFQSFYSRNKELGRCYLVGGKKNRIDYGEPHYAKDNKSLYTKEDGTWGIGVWMCGPDFIENPEVVDEETFVQVMLKLGVSQQKIDEFIKYEINWDDDIYGVGRNLS